MDVKKHVDTIIILSGILGSVFWMNSQFTVVESRFNSMEKEIAIIKTVMFMRGTLPAEFVTTKIVEESSKG